MPVIHFELDFNGRPIVELAISLSSNDRLTAPEGANPLLLTVNALVDTGASRSHIDIRKLDELDLVAAGEDDVHTASTGEVPEKMDRYFVGLSFLGDKPGLIARNLLVCGSDKLAGLRVDMLLGRDVLKTCLLVYDGGNNRFSLAYNPPASEPV